MKCPLWALVIVVICFSTFAGALETSKTQPTKTPQDLPLHDPYVVVSTLKGSCIHTNLEYYLFSQKFPHCSPRKAHEELVFDRTISGSSQSKRNSLNLIVTVTPQNSWSNDTFEAEFCGQMGPETASVEVVSNTPVWLLPDCFFADGSKVTLLTLYSIIIRGNTTFPDPLQRLAKSISQTPDVVSLTNSYLRTATDTKAIINWDAITSITSSVSKLSIMGPGIGIGSTIPTFPYTIGSLVLAGGGFGGTLPSPLFAANPIRTITDFVCDLSRNSLSGSIPYGFLSHVPWGSISLTSISINLMGNQLTGEIPATLITGTLPGVSSFSVVVSSNSLSGPIGNLFNFWLDPATLKTFTFAGTNNVFSGSLPTLFNGMSALTSFSFLCSNCSLQGTLSMPFLNVSANSTASILVTLSNNKWTGITSAFFQIPTAVRSVSASFNNGLLASLPSDLFDHANFTGTSTLSISFNQNKLTGNLPNIAGQFGSLNALSSYVFDISGNPMLTGTVPPTFLSSIVSSMTSTVATTKTLTIGLSNTGLTGSFELPDFSSAPGIKLTVCASSANFNSLVVPAEATSCITQLDLSNNTLLTGEVSSLFKNNPNMTSLSAQNTQLGGIMPDMSNMSLDLLASLNLASTQIDFCSGTRSNWTSLVLTDCNLSSTSAYNCSGLYPTQCLVSAPPPPVAPVPTTSTPIAPSPTGCSQSTRPSSDWNCIDGTWTFIGSVNSTTIVIPSGATTTIIKGNLTSSVVIINGLNSIIIVDGCTSNTTIIVELTPQQLEEIGGDGKLQQLLSFSNTSMCNSSTSDITIGTRIKGSSCKTVSVSKVPSSNGSLTGLFQVSRSGCNKWWIILVSVICVVILLGLVVATVAYVIHKKRSESRAHISLKDKAQS